MYIYAGKLKGTSIKFYAVRSILPDRNPSPPHVEYPDIEIAEQSMPLNTVRMCVSYRIYSLGLDSAHERVYLPLQGRRILHTL